MKAVILAGEGVFGTRLRPLTFTNPKPMVLLVNKPLIEHVVDYLVSYGLDDILVTTTFLLEMIMDHLMYREDVRRTLEFVPDEIAFDFAEDLFYPHPKSKCQNLYIPHPTYIWLPYMVAFRHGGLGGATNNIYVITSL